MTKILVTGSRGLIGSALIPLLEDAGVEVVRFDLREEGPLDTRSEEDFRKVLSGVEGVFHLAAVSRVIWGEKNPNDCWATNVGGLKNLLKASSSTKPWIAFASSREVYGHPDELPVKEDAPVVPANVYGYAKMEGERLINLARNDGWKASIFRLSNVYGSSDDWHDRVVPAFAKAAAEGAEVRVDGAGHTFDFTYVNDVAKGVRSLGYLLASGDAPPPIHFVSGEETSLGELASLAISQGASGMREAPERDYDVAHFRGCPARAKELLGWKHATPLRVGFSRLVAAFRGSR